MTGAPIHSGLEQQTTIAARPQCPKCRYDLTGLDTETCPECGGSCTFEDREIVPRRRRLRTALRIATMVIAPIVFLESVMVGLYAKSLVVFGEEADHLVAAFICYFAVPVALTVGWIWFGERAAREPEATPARLDNHFGNAGLAIGLTAIVGWFLPFLLLSSGMCFC